MEKLWIVLCPWKRRKYHWNLSLANSSRLQTICLGLLPDHHVETRDRASNHQVNEAHKVPYEKDHEHHTVQKRCSLYVVAIIGITIEQVVAVIQPNHHCSIRNCKSPNIVVQLVLISMPYDIDFHKLKEASGKVKHGEHHEPLSNRNSAASWICLSDHL